MLRPFELYRPESVIEASALLAEQGSDAALYAGGTELLLLLKEGLLRVRSLIDVKRIAGLGEIVTDDGAVTIGAAVTHRAVERSPFLRARCPLVAAVAAHVANVRVRTVGTVGGNLAFADPHSDLATLFLVFDASVRLTSGAGSRELPLGEFARGPYETARRPAEVLTGVRLRPWPPGTVGTYVKFGIHERPTLGLALALVLDQHGRTVREARLALGCVGPRPERLPAAERLAAGRSLAGLATAIDEVAAIAAGEVEPVTDLHGSAEYKREIARVFVRRAFEVALARAAGQAPQAHYPHAVVI